MTPIFDRFSRHGEDPDPGAISGIHSGNIGDIIYALPTVRALGITHMMLNVCEDPGAGGRILTEAMAKSLVSLLLEQPTIKTVDIVGVPVRLGAGYGHQAKVSTLVKGLPLEHIAPATLGVDYILDQFRLQPLERRHLVHAHAMAFGARVDPARAWIEQSVSATPGKGIAVSVTPRYRNRPNERLAEILDGFGPVTLIGFSKELPNYFGIEGELREFSDARELSTFLAGCSAFVGVPSFPAAIAEAMKIPRLIDLADDLVNVFPVGPNGWAMPETTEGARHLLAGLLREPGTVANRVKPAVQIAPPESRTSCRFTLEWEQAGAVIGGTHRVRAEAKLGRAPVRVHIEVPRLVDTPAAFELVMEARAGALEISNLRCVERGATLWTAREAGAMTMVDDNNVSAPPGILRWLRENDSPNRVRINVPETIRDRVREGHVSFVFDFRVPQISEAGQWAARAIVGLRDALSRERAGTERLQKELSSARQELSDSDDRLANVYQSTSWKVTGPLRRVVGLMKPQQGKVRHDK